MTGSFLSQSGHLCQNFKWPKNSERCNRQKAKIFKISKPSLFFKSQDLFLKSQDFLKAERYKMYTIIKIISLTMKLS